MLKNYFEIKFFCISKWLFLIIKLIKSLKIEQYMAWALINYEKNTLFSEVFRPFDQIATFSAIFGRKSEILPFGRKIFTFLPISPPFSLNFIFDNTRTFSLLAGFCIIPSIVLPPHGLFSYKIYSNFNLFLGYFLKVKAKIHLFWIDKNNYIKK